MQDPLREVESVIRGLTQTPPSEQRRCIETYFTPDASFTHPFCRTGSFGNSRFLIRAIYRWYKIMSPRIDLEVKSVAYDEKNLRMYVDISQVFRIWAIPFYAAHVDLVTVLQLRTHQEPRDHVSSSSSSSISSTSSSSSLTRNDARQDKDAADATAQKRYYIQSQNDLYQVNQFTKFVWPFPTFFLWAWQAWATLFCLLGALALWPVSALEEAGVVASAKVGGGEGGGGRGVGQEEGERVKVNGVGHRGHEGLDVKERDQRAEHGRGR